MSQAIEPTTELDTDGSRMRGGEISRTEVHDVLSNDRRIALLEQLSEESPQELGQLAEAIAAAETGESPPPRNKRQSVYVTLHQSHLPKLDDLGVVEYDAQQKRVALTERASVFFDGETDDEPADDGLEVFLGLVVVGLVASTASANGIAPFTAVSSATYAVVTLLALLVGFVYRLARNGSALAARLHEKFS